MEVIKFLWGFGTFFRTFSSIAPSNSAVVKCIPLYLKRDGKKEVTSYFLIDSAELCWCFKKNKTNNTILFVGSTDSARGRSVLKARSSSLCGRSRCCFIFTRVCGTGLCVRLRQRSYGILLNNNFFFLKSMYTAAVRGEQQSHQRANKARLQGRFGCFHPYQPTFHVPRGRTSLIIRSNWELRLQRGASWKRGIWCVFFHISQWRGNSLLSCRIVPSARRHPRDFHRVPFEGQFNGPFVFLCSSCFSGSFKTKGVRRHNKFVILLLFFFYEPNMPIKKKNNNS